MSADRELLELSAKAAGQEVHFDDRGRPHMSDGGCFSNGMTSLGFVENVVPWNPLTDDGDALRLAVKLKLIVTFADGGAGPHVCAGRRLGPFSNEPLPVRHFLEMQDSDLSATRRAIVRAAAEIGRSM